MPVARAAFFATRLSPAPVLRTVRLADFTIFVVFDFLRLAILFPPSLSAHGFRIWNLTRNGAGVVHSSSPVLRAVEMTGTHHHLHCACCDATCMCGNLFRLLPAGPRTSHPAKARVRTC